MTRVKGAVHALKRRRSVLEQAKGYRFGRGTKERQAKEAIIHAGVHAFAHRKTKKRNFRRLWTTRINAALRALNIGPYGRFIDTLKKKNVALDRKVLSELAKDHPEVFERAVKELE
jgi:large subunit ribosomal protein L20